MVSGRIIAAEFVRSVVFWLYAAAWLAFMLWLNACAVQPSGSCNPYADGPDHVTSADCSGATPVCDAVDRRCVAATGYPCQACNDTSECQDGATCDTVQRVGSYYAPGLIGADRACHVSCVSCSAYGLGCYNVGSCGTGADGACWRWSGAATPRRVTP